MQGTFQAIDYSQDLKAHAAMLAGFFPALFRERDTVHIFPLLRKDSPLTPEIPESECSSVWDTVLPDAEKTFSRRPGSTTTKTLEELHRLNRMGYDIYFCVNPLACSYRCQKTVRLARNILLEVDDVNLGLNGHLDIFRPYKGYVATAVYSGRRSLHMIVRLDPWLWNKACVHPKHAYGLKETPHAWPEFVDLADRWIVRFKLDDYIIDPVARDYSHLSRVPGFIHAGTGNPVTFEHVNLNAGWNWKKDDLDIYKDYEPSVEEMDEYFAKQEAKHEGMKNGPCRVTRAEGDCHGVVAGRTAEGFVDEHRPSTGHGGNPPTCEDTARTGRKEVRTSTTIVVRRTSFLDDIKQFQGLLQHGLPGRGMRMKMHKVAFTVARVFTWTNATLAKKWRQVIQRNPGATDKTVDQAVDAILGDWEANADFNVFLPNTASLVDLSKQQMATLTDRLDGMACPDVEKATRIIVKVLLPLVKTLPRQCESGTVNIKSANLRDATNIRGNRGYASIWMWMQDAHIVTCTDPSYVEGRRTRQYRVNIPLVIWHAGYKTDQLDWGVAASCQSERVNAESSKLRLWLP